MTPIVLILQNERFYADYMEQIFVELGFTVGGAFCSSRHAQEWLVDHEPDVALIDAEVQDGDCIKLVEGLNARKVPFVVYSTVALKGRPVDPMFKRGTFLKKPARPEKVLEAVERARARASIHQAAASR